MGNPIEARAAFENPGESAPLGTMTVKRRDLYVPGLLPHRGKWALVENLTVNLDQNTASGTCRVRPSLVFGHFDTVPGVIVTEMIHQAGAAMLLLLLRQQGKLGTGRAIHTIVSEDGTIKYGRKTAAEPNGTNFEVCMTWHKRPRECFKQRITGKLMRNEMPVAALDFEGLAMYADTGDMIRI